MTWGNLTVHDTIPLLRVLVLRTSFTVRYMGPLDHPYLGFHPLIAPGTSCPPPFSVDLSCPSPRFIPLSFLSYIHFSFIPFFSRTDSYYIWKMDFFSIFSNFLLSFSNTLDCISYCPIHRAI